MSVSNNSRLRSTHYSIQLGVLLAIHRISQLLLFEFPQRHSLLMSAKSKVCGVCLFHHTRIFNNFVLSFKVSVLYHIFSHLSIPFSKFSESCFESLFCLISQNTLDYTIIILYCQAIFTNFFRFSCGAVNYRPSLIMSGLYHNNFVLSRGLQKIF